MNLSVSPRLLACCGFIQPNARVADIGCDHGYLGIYLLKNKIASSVIAADVNEGPLQSAIRNAEKFGVREQMTFYLSDGFRNIPRDFDVAVCAGMGADTMISILDAAPWLKDSRYGLILQCQSKTPMLRQYLSEKGWYIYKELVIRDGKFLYTVMKVHWKPGFPLTCGECYFPPAIQENPSQEGLEYYRWVKNGLIKIINGRGPTADPVIVKALQELEELKHDPDLAWLKEER